MTAKIVKYDNIYCIAESFTSSNQPEYITSFWPIGHMSRSIDLNEFENYEVSRSRGLCYMYDLRLSAYNYVTIYLKERGQTRSIHTEIKFILCPKVRSGIETRWHQGRWEKYLKTKGWVPA